MDREGIMLRTEMGLKPRWILAPALLLAVVLQTPAALADISGKVVAVTDGDTIKVLDANHAQLLSGMAWWYRYYASSQPAEDRGRYESAEDEARARRRGLWSDPNPINPYQWRQGQR